MFRSALGSVALTLAILLLIAPARAGTPATAAERRLETALDDLNLPGLAVSVRTADGSVWTGTSGFADRKTRRRVTASTPFRLGSVSKALTSVALGRLIEEGKIDLDAPIQRYAPSFPVKPEGEITVRQLASHQSGLPHYRRSDFVNKRHYESLTLALDKFKDRPLVSAPGAEFHYSSFGWNLLGAALEGAAGKDFLELMRDTVFKPLGMESAAPDRAETPDRARPYARLGFVTLRAPRIDNSDAWPSAGFVATTRDLVRFGESMLEARLLARETIDLLWSRTVTDSGETNSYGLGWQWTEIGGRRAVGHGGSHVGATANLWILPDEGLILAMATNTNAPPGSLGELADEISRLFLGDA